MTGRRGRPRDPQVDARVRDVVVRLLGEKRWPNFTADQIARQACSSKASLYRRWPSLTQLVADVVRGLGGPLAGVDFGEGQGSLRGDLIAVVAAATTGPEAAAVVGVLSACGTDGDLLGAYLAGPRGELVKALDRVDQRALLRGDGPPYWPSVHAAVAYLQWEQLIVGTEPDPGRIGRVVDDVTSAMPPERAARPVVAATAQPTPVSSHTQPSQDGAHE